jgi:hypothetical protein
MTFTLGFTDFEDNALSKARTISKDSFIPIRSPDSITLLK